MIEAIPQRNSCLVISNMELVLQIVERHRDEIFRKLSRLAAEHETDLLSVLDSEERALLAKLCQKVADSHGLFPGVHAGHPDL